MLIIILYVFEGMTLWAENTSIKLTTSVKLKDVIFQQELKDIVHIVMRK